MAVTINGTTGITNDGGYTGDGVVFADTTPANTLVTTTGGNVGVGASAPGYRLEVASNDNAVGFGYAMRLKSSATAGAAAIQFTNSSASAENGYIRVTDTGLMSLSNRAYLLPNGSFTVGRSDSPGDSPVSVLSPNNVNCLHLSSNAIGGAGGQITQTNNNTGAAKSLRVTPSNEWEIVNSAYTAVIFQVTNAGQVYNSTGTYGTISDVRLKENIVDARDYLSDICKLRVVKYSLKSEQATTPTKLGLIAQEVEQIFPGMIEEGANTFEGPETVKQLKMSVLTPMLLKAIQEQQAIITALTARVAALEGTQP